MGQPFNCMSFHTLWIVPISSTACVHILLQYMIMFQYYITRITHAHPDDENETDVFLYLCRVSVLTLPSHPPISLSLSSTLYVAALCWPCLPNDMEHRLVQEVVRIIGWKRNKDASSWPCTHYLAPCRLSMSTRGTTMKRQRGPPGKLFTSILALSFLALRSGLLLLVVLYSILLYSRLYNEFNT